MTHSRPQALARQNRRNRALARPELSQDPGKFKFTAPSSPISAPIKQDDPETRRLIDEALAKWRVRPCNSSKGGRLLTEWLK